MRVLAYLHSEMALGRRVGSDTRERGDGEVWVARASVAMEVTSARSGGSRQVSRPRCDGTTGARRESQSRGWAAQALRRAVW